MIVNYIIYLNHQKKNQKSNLIGQKLLNQNYPFQKGKKFQKKSAKNKCGSKSLIEFIMIFI